MRSVCIHKYKIGGDIIFDGVCYQFRYLEILVQGPTIFGSAREENSLGKIFQWSNQELNKKLNRRLRLYFQKFIRRKRSEISREHF